MLLRLQTVSLALLACCRKSGVHQLGGGLANCTIKDLDVSHNSFVGNVANVLDTYQHLSLEVCNNLARSLCLPYLDRVLVIWLDTTMPRFLCTAAQLSGPEIAAGTESQLM